MEQTLKNVSWESYLLFALVILFSGFLSLVFLPLLLECRRSPEDRTVQLVFNLFAVAVISYGVGQNIALYENANIVNCT